MTALGRYVIKGADDYFGYTPASWSLPTLDAAKLVNYFAKAYCGSSPAFFRFRPELFRETYSIRSFDFLSLSFTTANHSGIRRAPEPIEPYSLEGDPYKYAMRLILEEGFSILPARANVPYQDLPYGSNLAQWLKHADQTKIASPQNKVTFTVESLVKVLRLGASADDQGWLNAPLEELTFEQLRSIFAQRAFSLLRETESSEFTVLNLSGEDRPGPLDDIINAALTGFPQEAVDNAFKFDRRLLSYINPLPSKVFDVGAKKVEEARGPGLFVMVSSLDVTVPDSSFGSRLFRLFVNRRDLCKDPHFLIFDAATIPNGFFDGTTAVFLPSEDPTASVQLLNLLLGESARPVFLNMDDFNVTANRSGGASSSNAYLDQALKSLVQVVLTHQALKDQ